MKLSHCSHNPRLNQFHARLSVKIAQRNALSAHPTSTHNFCLYAQSKQTSTISDSALNHNNRPHSLLLRSIITSIRTLRLCAWPPLTSRRQCTLNHNEAFTPSALTPSREKYQLQMDAQSLLADASKSRAIHVKCSRTQDSRPIMVYPNVPRFWKLFLRL